MKKRSKKKVISFYKMLFHFPEVKVRLCRKKKLRFLKNLLCKELSNGAKVDIFQRNQIWKCTLMQHKRI